MTELRAFLWWVVLRIFVLLNLSSSFFPPFSECSSNYTVSETKRPYLMLSTDQTIVKNVIKFFVGHSEGIEFF